MKAEIHCFPSKHLEGCYKGRRFRLRRNVLAVGLGARFDLSALYEGGGDRISRRW